jgi:protein involved in polysaccharide export with SLBB domain
METERFIVYSALNKVKMSLLGILFVVIIVSGCTSHYLSLSDKKETELSLHECGKVRDEFLPESPELPDTAIPETVKKIVTKESQAVEAPVEVTIQPGCLVQINVKEDPSLDGSYPVNEIGAIELGYIGAVILHNCTEREAEEQIRKILMRRAFKTATVNVKITRASYDSIRVKGDVNKPGLIRIGSGSVITLNDALLRVDGIRGSAKETTVRIIRGGMTNAVAESLPGEEYTLVDENGKPRVPDVTLRNNDVVYVFAWRGKPAPDAGWKEVLVLGEVKKPGTYRFAPNEKSTLLHLILKMEGLPPFADKRAIKIVRRDEDGYEREIQVDASRLLKYGKPEDDFLLEDGDRVIVPERRLTLF